MTACSRSTCFAPDTTCDLGHLGWTDCPAWRRSGDTEPSQPLKESGELLLPWSGAALGLADIGFVAGSQKPLVVGIVGPENAGKTTLLAAWYLLVGRGLTGSSDRQFAGSYSLAGWESVASSLRWAPGQKPSFPPHTTSRGGRMPGLLHLAFRTANCPSHAYVFADAPGEWFQRWAVNRDAVDCEGARWVSEHTDVFLLIADCAALSGANRGAARGSLQLLARRLSAERAERPVALVWTKADIAVAPEMKTAIRGAVLGQMPEAREFSVSIKPDSDEASDRGQGLLELFDWTISIRRAGAKLPPLGAESNDPIFMLGKRQE